MKNKYLMLIRHFETFQNSKNKEKIKFKESFNKSIWFIDFIEIYIKKYPQIKKIKFFTSEHERTIMTSLILSSSIKSEILKNKFLNIQIFDPIINDMIDRDPKKKNKKNVCIYFKKNIEELFEEDTLYIYITHSSIIYNLFKCILENILNTKFEHFNKRIHDYSISCIAKTNDKLSYIFNKKIEQK